MQGWGCNNACLLFLCYLYCVSNSFRGVEPLAVSVPALLTAGCKVGDRMLLVLNRSGAGVDVRIVRRTHTIVRFQTRIRRKDGTENFGGFVYVFDFHNAIFCCRFLCARLISVYSVSVLCLFCLFSLFSGYHDEGYHAPSIPYGLSRLHHHCTATTPVYVYPGYHAIVLSSIPRLSHLSYHGPPHT